MNDTRQERVKSQDIEKYRKGQALYEGIHEAKKVEREQEKQEKQENGAISKRLNQLKSP
jgi:hypothetical protein